MAKKVRPAEPSFETSLLPFGGRRLPDAEYDVLNSIAL
jgi:hypothetical protein